MTPYGIASLYWINEKTHNRYSDVIMSSMASQITSLMIVYSMVYSGADQRKHQSSALLAFVRGIFPSQRASNAENVIAGPAVWTALLASLDIDPMKPGGAYVSVK